MADLRALYGALDAGEPPVDIPPEQQMEDAIMAAGLSPPSKGVVLDGKVHRFNVDGRKDKSGWYVGFRDGIPAGRFGCWRKGISEKWRAQVGRELTAAEELEYARWLAEAQRLRDIEAEERHELAADVVMQIWSEAPPAPADHLYLVRKGIKPHSLRVTGDGRLIAPLFGVDAVLSSVQYIDADGRKLYHSAGEVEGKFCMLGTASFDDKDVVEGTIYMTEGYATGATVHEVTGRPTVIAYSAGALPVMMGVLRELWGAEADIVIVADNDVKGAGQRYAEQACAKHGGRFVVPPTLGDANDYVKMHPGKLEELLSPSTSNWLVRATDFAAQPAPIAWLVKGWLQALALIMVHGPSGHGKTFVVLDWCCRMGAGLLEWRGHKVRAGTVVYLAGEGHHGLRGRVAAWQHQHQLQVRNLWISRSGCDLDKADGLHKAVAAIDSLPTPPALIVVDTLHRFLSGDENSAQDAKEMLDSCAELQSRYKCSVLLVHHTGNNAEAQGRARGSSAWRGALDVEISVSRDGGDADVITVAQRKSKDAEMLAPLHAALQRVEIPGWVDEDGQQVTSAVLVSADAPAHRSKADKGLEGHRVLLERAWWASGAEKHDGAPYVSRSALEAFLADPAGGGKTEQTAEKYVKPSFKNGLVARLVESGYLAPAANGWVVSDPANASALLLQLSDD